MISILLFISEAAIPFFIFIIVGFGLLQKQHIYDDFIKGAKDGIMTVVGIMPTLIGLMIGTGVLRASGFLEFLGNILSKITSYFHFPAELVPLTLVKMFSSSAATGLLLDLFKEHGTDSFIGLCASIMMSSTETIFYTMSIYFMTAKVTKTRYTLTGALLSTFFGIAASVVLSTFL